MDELTEEQSSKAEAIFDKIVEDGGYGADECLLDVVAKDKLRLRVQSIMSSVTELQELLK